MRETSNPGESSKPVMAVGGGSSLSVYTVQLVNEIRSAVYSVIWKHSSSYHILNLLIFAAAFFIFEIQPETVLPGMRNSLF